MLSPTSDPFEIHAFEQILWELRGNDLFAGTAERNVLLFQRVGV